MSSLIFYFWRATVLTFLRNGLKLLKDKALEILPKYGRTEAKVGLRIAERILFEALQLILALHFKMLSVALPGLVFIRIFSEETYICHLYAYLLACFYERHHRYHIYFYLDDSELWKQYHSVSQEMMEQICDLQTSRKKSQSRFV